MACLAAGAAACSLGFDRFDPASGAGDARAGDSGSTESDASEGGGDSGGVTPDGSPGGDGSAGGCGGLQACLAQATTCGMPCAQNYQQCTSMCGGNSCRQQCKQTETMCRTQCATACTSCTTTAGCPDAAQCTTASQM